jgi:hypothetical protein
VHLATHPLQLPHPMNPCFRWERLAVDRGRYPISVQADRGRIIFDRPFIPDEVPQLSIRNLRCGKVAVDLLLKRRNNSVLIHRENCQEEVEIVTIVW